MKEIQLTQDKVARVSDTDYNKLSGWKWQAVLIEGIWYARRRESMTVGGKSVMMHREIMGNPVGYQVDHKDRDGLNNQRDNLRVCTNSKNQQNSKLRKTNLSGYKGVSWNKKLSKYYVRIQIDKKQKNLGYFVTAEEAARKYDEFAVRLFGEFARLNFPDS